MNDSPTSLSLLERVRDPTDAPSWRRLVELYTPMIRKWMRQYGVPDSDTDDFVQEVFRTLAQEISTFRHNGNHGAFRKWMRLTLVHRLRDFWRSRNTRTWITGEMGDRILAEMSDPDSDPNVAWEREHDLFVTRRLMELIEPEFTTSTWQAFRRQMVDGARPAEVATELGMTTNAVMIAKSRVLRRFRQEVQGLVDDNESSPTNAITD